jgi:hypothetical protein
MSDKNPAFDEWFEKTWDMKYDNYDLRHRPQFHAWKAASDHEKKRIKLFLSGLLMRTSDTADENKWFSMSYAVEEAIGNFIKDLEE